MINKEAFQKLLDQYKSNFNARWESVRFNWVAVKTFQANWDINAVDFPKMLKKSLKDAKQVIDIASFQPVPTIVKFAQNRPDGARAMFEGLFNEETALYERVRSFKDKAKQLSGEIGDPGTAFFADEATALAFLWLRFPDKYYGYNFSTVECLAKKLGSDYTLKRPENESNINQFMAFYNEISDTLRQDQGMVETLRACLTDNCYPDDALRTLTVDFTDYASYIVDEEHPIFEIVDGYPVITVDGWSKLLNDKRVFRLSSLGLMKCMRESGGSASCKQLSQKYGRHFSAYNRIMNFLGRNVEAAIGCPDENRYQEGWMIVCHVKYNDGEAGDGSFVWTLCNELSEALDKFDLTDIPFLTGETTTVEEGAMPDQDPNNHVNDARYDWPEKNMILYGPPGTGKTYGTVFYAVSIIEKRTLANVQAEGYAEVHARYQAYKEQGLIAFTTFHQSYDYEQFIEGISPKLESSEDSAETGDIQYELRDGIFKSFCNQASIPSGANNLGIGKSPTVWKVSLAGTGDNPVRRECLENGHIRVGFDDQGEDITGYERGRNVLDTFFNKMQLGDIIFSCFSNRTIDAIGVITGEAKWDESFTDGYKRVREVKWLAKGLNTDIVDLNGGKVMTLATIHRLNVSPADALDLLRKVAEPGLFHGAEDTKNRVFIIDEINRGNISNIFGELITLLETGKRGGTAEEASAILPYSGKRFSVPANVYVIGTMNTADRSIAMLDTALRRRFSFYEVLPDYDYLSDAEVGDINIGVMLRAINRRISILLDREHVIGHSYFKPLKTSLRNGLAASVADLAEIFKRHVIPLLQEYFYDDYEKIRLVLGDNLKADPNNCFISKTPTSSEFQNLAGDDDVDLGNIPEYYYEVNESAFTKVAAYEFLKR